MNSHLISVKISVESGTDQRMNLQGFTLHQNRLEGLYAQTMQGGCPVEKHTVILDNLLEDIPYLGHSTFYHFLGTLDRLNIPFLCQFLDDKWFEEFQCHIFGKTALMESEIWPNDDDTPSRVVHTLAEEILTETALLPSQEIRQALERTVTISPNRPRTPTVVDKSVHRFLQHSFLVPENDIRSLDFNEFLQTVVAVDYPAVEVIEVRGCKASTIQRYQGTKVGRDHRNHVQNHPFRAVIGMSKCLHNLKTLESFLFALNGGLHADLKPEFSREFLRIDFCEELMNSRSTHPGSNLAPLFKVIPQFLLSDDVTLGDRSGSRVQHKVSLIIKYSLQISHTDAEKVADPGW